MSLAPPPPSFASLCLQVEPRSVALTPLPQCEALFRAVVDAGSDLADVAAELSGCRTLAYRDSLPSGLIGAYVPVLSRLGGFHVGLVSDVCSCDLLTRVVERVRPGTAVSVGGALGELARELCLHFVRRADPELDLIPGPPVFVDGMARRTRSSRLRAAEVAFGHLRATLTLSAWDAVRVSDWPGR